MNRILVKFAFAMLAALVWTAGSARTYTLPQGRFCNAASGTFGNSLPANMCFQFDNAYGSDPLQKFDVYMPNFKVQGAPVILMVHGGEWTQGDKFDNNVVLNKVQYWIPKGAILISVNYPLVPQVNPLQEALDVAQALAYAQLHAADWGGDPHKFILMGFSAGGHLVSLLAAEPSLATSLGAQPWLGTVALDSAAYDIPEVMANPHHPTFFNEAFGTSTDLWYAASPELQLNARIAPFLAVCSSQEAGSCPRAQEFVQKAMSYGTSATILQENLAHEQIDANLGLASDYTTQVNAFVSAVYQGALMAKPATVRPRRLIGH
jgi:arylformamidase